MFAGEVDEPVAMAAVGPRECDLAGELAELIEQRDAALLSWAFAPLTSTTGTTSSDIPRQLTEMRRLGPPTFLPLPQPRVEAMTVSATRTECESTIPAVGPSECRSDCRARPWSWWWNSGAALLAPSAD